MRHCLTAFGLYFEHFAYFFLLDALFPANNVLMPLQASLWVTWEGAQPHTRTWMQLNPLVPLTSFAMPQK